MDGKIVVLAAITKMRRVSLSTAMLLASIDIAGAQSNHGPAYPTNQHTKAYPSDQHTPAYPKSTLKSRPAAQGAQKPALGFYLTLIFGNHHSWPRTAVLKTAQCTSWTPLDNTGKAFRCAQSSPLKPQLFDSYDACQAVGKAFKAPASDPQHIISSFRCREARP